MPQLLQRSSPRCRSCLQQRAPGWDWQSCVAWVQTGNPERAEAAHTCACTCGSQTTLGMLLHSLGLSFFIHKMGLVHSSQAL